MAQLMLDSLYMKKSLFRFIMCLCASAAWAGVIDNASRSVVFLTDSKPVTEDVNGVHYLVAFKNPTNDTFLVKRTTFSGSGAIVISSNVCYLVTAKHVALQMTPDCELLMSGDNGEPIQFKLSSITGQQPGVRWFHHPDADVSIYPLPIGTPEVLKEMNNRAFPLSFLESGTNIPSRDVFVTALGFPLGLGTQGKVIPLSRESKVACGWLYDANGYYFLLQDPSVEGYSGGPLIESGDIRLINTPSGAATVTSPARCWGFVSGNYADETGGKMCRITPAFYAVELIHEAQTNLCIITVPYPKDRH
jgi:hypothetical protein